MKTLLLALAILVVFFVVLYVVIPLPYGNAIASGIGGAWIGSYAYKLAQELIEHYKI